MDTRNTRRRAIMRKSISAPIALLVFLLIVSLLASHASALPLSSRRLMISGDTTRITIPDHSSQVGFRFWGGRKLLSTVHTNDYGEPGASGKHDPSTGSR